MLEEKKPLYIVTIEAIINYIRINQLKPGDQIPSEPDLVHMLHVSRATVRMAIQEMVNMGQLEKKHGKGTFLAYPSMQIDINKFISFSSTAKLMGLPYESKIVRFQKIHEYSEDITKNLELSVNDEVYEIVRLRLLDGEISLLDYTYLPAKLFPNLKKEMFLKDSLYTICDAYGYYFMTGKESFIPHKIGKEDSVLLECKEGDPAILLVKVMSHYNQRVEYTKGLFKKSKFELTANIVKINV